MIHGPTAIAIGPIGTTPDSMPTTENAGIWTFWRPSLVDFVGIFFVISLPIGSMYGIYANIGGILMVNVTIYIAYMDPMGYDKWHRMPLLA